PRPAPTTEARPSTSTDPDTRAVGTSRNSPIAASAVTVLPHPDSPTIPSAPPAATDSDTPSTAPDAPPQGTPRRGPATRRRPRRRTPPADRAPTATRSSIPHPRIEERIHDVDRD